MKIDRTAKRLIDRIASGKLNAFAEHLNGTDFGLYIPTFVDQGIVRLMEDGYSQTETNLQVTVQKRSDRVPDDYQTVAWIGGGNHKDTECRHPGSKDCRHCTQHEGQCRHCSGHPRKLALSGELDAPELDYSKTVDEFTKREEILSSLSEEGCGLALLHGHNSTHKFTKLPENYVSVISNGTTFFRTTHEVEKDATFVPNMWRFVNGSIRVAGGYSEV